MRRGWREAHTPHSRCPQPPPPPLYGSARRTSRRGKRCDRTRTQPPRHGPSGPTWPTSSARAPAPTAPALRRRTPVEGPWIMPPPTPLEKEGLKRAELRMVKFDEEQKAAKRRRATEVVDQSARPRSLREELEQPTSVPGGAFQHLTPRERALRLQQMNRGLGGGTPGRPPVCRRCPLCPYGPPRKSWEQSAHPPPPCLCFGSEEAVKRCPAAHRAPKAAGVAAAREGFEASRL